MLLKQAEIEYFIGETKSISINIMRSDGAVFTVNGSIIIYTDSGIISVTPSLVAITGGGTSVNTASYLWTPALPGRYKAVISVTDGIVIQMFEVAVQVYPPPI